MILLNFLEKIDNFEVKIIALIQKLQNPVFDFIFKYITLIGDVGFFAILAIIIYWTISKKEGAKFLFAFILSGAANTISKKIVSRNRPYTHAEVKSIGSPTDGYSFPSGHAQNVAVISYGTYKSNLSKKIKLSIIIFIAVLVPFSRLYLGQHFLSDVLVGLTLGLVSAVVAYHIFKLMKDREEVYMLYLIPVFLLALFYPHDLMYLAVGSFVGFYIGYFFEKRYVKYDVNDSLLNQFLKVLLGGGIIVLIYFIYEWLFPSNPPVKSLIQFMTITFFASYLAPLMFKAIFSKNQH